MGRRLDVVLCGATGFTGQLAAGYLSRVARRDSPPVRWAIVGRDAARLDALAQRLREQGGDVPELLVASLMEQSEVDGVVEQARVVISTAGPYAVCGTAIVDACVRFGTDYVDITGEAGWVRKMIDAYDGAALTKGVLLVPSCGYDALPSDVGETAPPGGLPMACFWSLTAVVSHVTRRFLDGPACAQEVWRSSETHNELRGFERRNVWWHCRLRHFECGNGEWAASSVR